MHTCSHTLLLTPGRRGMGAGGCSGASQFRFLIPLHWIKFSLFFFFSPRDFAQKSLYHSSLGHKLIQSGGQPMFWWERGSCCRRFNSIRTDSNMSSSSYEWDLKSFTLVPERGGRGARAPTHPLTQISSITTGPFDSIMLTDSSRWMLLSHLSPLQPVCPGRPQFFGTI